MPIRKHVEESVIRAGTRDEWVGRAAEAMKAARFSKVSRSVAEGRVTGRARSFKGFGDLTVTMTPEQDGTVMCLHLRATAAADNFAVKGAAHERRIIDRFKAELA